MLNQDYFEIEKKKKNHFKIEKKNQNHFIIEKKNNFKIEKKKATFKEHPEECGQVEVSQDNLSLHLQRRLSELITVVMMNQ